MCRRNLRVLVNLPGKDVSCLPGDVETVEAYLSMSLTTRVGVLILRLQDWQLRGAQSSIVTDGAGRHSGRSWGCCRGV